MSSDNRPLVLVTGVSGYIATHVAQQLLQDGYQVRGTVRSLNNEQKIKPLRDLCPGSKHQLELVEADLTEDAGWNEAVKGCSYVMHTASPVNIENSADPMDTIGPAVIGTIKVFKACQQTGCVKRVVFTSSTAAIDQGPDWPEDKVFTEDDWTDLNKAPTDYTKSKILAEQAAWKFIEDLPADEKFELAVLNPCLVLGPVLCGSHTASLEFPSQLFSGKMPALLNIHFRIVDVRNVAKAHLAAMTTPEAAGKRHILAPNGMWLKDVVDVYQEEFGPMGYTFPRYQAPYFLAWLYGFWNKKMSFLLHRWGKVTKSRSDRMTKVLGIEPYPLKNTLIDMVYSMIEKGFIHKTPQYEERQKTAGQ